MRPFCELSIWATRVDSHPPQKFPTYRSKQQTYTKTRRQLKNFTKLGTWPNQTFEEVLADAVGIHKWTVRVVPPPWRMVIYPIICQPATLPKPKTDLGDRRLS